MDVDIAYKNIEKMITLGFLSVRVSFFGHDLLIKNITDKEYSQIESICSEKHKDKRLFLNLAFSTQSIDGINLLSDREKYLKKLIEFYQRIAVIPVIKIIETINDLNSTYSNSINFLEGFSYSDRSRYLWSAVDISHRSLYWGIKGLDGVGINSVQENWVVINKKIDEEEKYARDLNLTLLVVGAQNQKSAKTISKNFEFHKNELDELRKEIIKYGYNKRREEENRKKREQWTAPLNTREDLVRELYRQMRGDKDKHDLFMDKWILQQRYKAEMAKKNVIDLQTDFRKKMEDVDLTQLEPSRPISNEELDRIFSQKKDNRNKSYMEADIQKDKRDRAFKKLSARIIKPESN